MKKGTLFYFSAPLVDPCLAEPGREKKEKKKRKTVAHPPWQTHEAHVLLIHPGFILTSHWTELWTKNWCVKVSTFFSLIFLNILLSR